MLVEPDTEATGTCGASDSNGSPPDIGQLIRDHHRPLYRYAYRLAGSETDAEELVQQTFVIAHEKLRQVRDFGKIRSWLFAVLRSCYLKDRRKRTPTPASSMELDVERIPQDAMADDDIDREQLQQAIDELPDEYKTVIVMFYFEECSYKEIAASLEVPIGTVMSRLARAKGRLRQKLLSGEKVR